MTTDRIRIGAFGVGRMGRVHVEHLCALRDAGVVEFAAIGDRHGPTLSAATALVAELGGPGRAAPLAEFETPEAMAAGARLDSVVVASRTMDHARDSLAFIRAGIPVLVEKPLANSIAEAAAFRRELGEAADRRLQVAFQRRFDAAANLAIGWVDEGRLGRLQQSHHVLQDKNPTPVGYQSCGITADMAVHLVYEAMSLHEFKLPDSVRALRFLAPHYDDRAGEGANVVHAFLTWADGAVAHLWGSRINSAGYDNGFTLVSAGYDNGFTLVGTDGRVDVGEFAGEFGAIEARLWSGRGETRGRLLASASFPMTRAAGRHPDFYPRYAAAYARELDAFVERARSDGPFDPGVDIGWKTLLIANLAEASSRSDGRRFDLTYPGGPAITTADQAAAFAKAAGAE